MKAAGFTITFRQSLSQVPTAYAPIMPATNFAGDFTLTGFRVPLIVISPFSKKNFVSHTPMDFTAALKLIETRFKLPNLTARDAAMPDMSEFFDFSTSTGPWGTPPVPPPQPVNMPCTQGVPIRMIPSFPEAREFSSSPGLDLG